MLPRYFRIPYALAVLACGSAFSQSPSDPNELNPGAPRAGYAVATDGYCFHDPQSSPDICPDCCQRWYARIDALILTRDNASTNRPVVIADDTGATVLGTHSFDFHWNGGPRAFLGRTYTDGGWELGYFGLNGSTTSVSAADPNNLDIPPPLSAVANDFDNANGMTLSWDWVINNAEVNVFRDFDGIQLIAGFRYFNLEERFNIHAIDADGDQSDYHVSTSNNLYGAQMGATGARNWNGFQLGGSAKAGIFGNDSIERQIVRDNDNITILRDTSGRGALTAFVGDIDVSLSYRLTDHLRMRGGYYLLWVTQVALAPDQLDFTFNADSGKQLHDGSVFFHGASAGLEATW